MSNVLSEIENVVSKLVFAPTGVLFPLESASWPIAAKNAEELHASLLASGQLEPLPSEPAVLASMLSDFVIKRIHKQLQKTAQVSAGNSRSYPALEVQDSQGKFVAIDVKVARRAPGGSRTQSRITLFTGNTYFRHPSLKWGNMKRPFASYQQHIHVFAIYSHSPTSRSPVSNLEFVVTEPWRVASKKRSSTTREYIGAVDSIADLRQGGGEFSSEEDFVSFWQKFDFRVGKSVQKQLDKALADLAKK